MPPSGALPENVGDIIDESEQLLEQLRIEVHSITNKDQKQRVLAQMKSYQAEIETIKRRQLTGNGNSGAALNEDERHQQNMARLHQARQQLHDSEVLAQQTIENLDQQEETMRRTTGNVRLCHYMICFIPPSMLLILSRLFYSTG